MNIFVLIKQIPVISDFKIDARTFTVDRSNAGTMLNPADANAIEAALALKDRFGGSVTVLSMGTDPVAAQLREALALGADDAVRITDSLYAGADTLVTAKILHKAILQLGDFDCILCGEYTLDGATGQIPGKLAALLNIPLLSSAALLDASEHSLKIHTKAGHGYAVWQADYPLVCSVTEGSNKPRMATLKGRMHAKKAEIRCFNNEILQLSKAELCSPSKIEALFPMQEKETASLITGEPEAAARQLVSLLTEQNLI